jgi:lysophospholipase L1-like esterase
MWATGDFGYLSDYLLFWVAVLSLGIHTWCFFHLFPRTWAKMRLVIGNVLVFTCLLAVVALGAESYLRFVSTGTDAYGATLTCKRWHKVYAPTNSLGHRDKEWSEAKPPGVRRIAFVGDSYTYGWGINDPADRFTDILQRRFDAREGPGKVEVMNVAWRGWDTAAQVRELKRLIPTYGIDEVVLCYVPNDIETVLPVTEGFDPKRPPQTVYLRTDQSFLLDYLYYRLFAPRSQGAAPYLDWIAEGYSSETTWRAQEARLGEIIQVCREHGVRLGVVLLPFLRTSGTRYDAERIHGVVRRFFESNGVAVIDLRGAVSGQDPRRLAVNAHDYHPNETAQRRFADAIEAGLYGGGK